MAEKYSSLSLWQKSIIPFTLIEKYYPFHYGRKVFIPFIMAEKYYPFHYDRKVLSLSLWQVSVIRNMNYATVSYFF